MTLGVIGRGFNHMAIRLQAAGKHVPQPVVSGMTFFADQVRTDGFKTLVVKPIVLVNSVLKFAHQNENYPTLAKFSKHGCQVKALISIAEVFAKLPGMLADLSRPVEADVSGRGFWGTTSQHRQMEGPCSTPAEAVCGKMVSLASWCISVGDTICAVGKYRALPSIFNRATPWIYSAAGGYLGLRGVYEESKFQVITWKRSAPAEKYLGVLNLATSVNYCLQAASGFAGLYWKGQAPAWLAKWQFAFTVGSTVLPAAQKCAQSWVRNHGAPSKIDERDD